MKFALMILVSLVSVNSYAATGDVHGLVRTVMEHNAGVHAGTHHALPGTTPCTVEVETLPTVNSNYGPNNPLPPMIRVRPGTPNEEGAQRFPVVNASDLRLENSVSMTGPARLQAPLAVFSAPRGSYLIQFHPNTLKIRSVALLNDHGKELLNCQLK